MRTTYRETYHVTELAFRTDRLQNQMDLMLFNFMRSPDCDDRNISACQRKFTGMPKGHKGQEVL